MPSVTTRSDASYCPVRRRNDRLISESELTPEEGPGLASGPLFQVHSDRTDGIDGSRTRRVAGEHHIEIREVALAQTFVEIADFLGARSCSAELSIPGVITYEVR